MTTGEPNLEPANTDSALMIDEQLPLTPRTASAIHSSTSSGAEESDASQMAPGAISASQSPLLSREKEEEWASLVGKKLHLLELPLDILTQIVRETNDLTSLALTHSALHSLAIPHIYSRFDIIWPEKSTSDESRSGVDALSYGLATLAKGQLDADHPQTITCTSCGMQNVVECNHETKRSGNKFPLGNQYSQFTRKFSLGNGPADWVQEYLITKESGKMLGTLVALAVARMVHLETFVWDMPTGVLTDVWLALASLQSRSPHEECRLERVWVRWHDNSETNGALTQTSPTSNTTPQMLAGSQMTSIGWTLPSSSPSSQNLSQPVSYAQSRVEYPTLSVLPPLKSLSVLDIDELSYLDEMSVLIAKSKDRLRELRVGISTKAINKDFAIAWDGSDLHQVDHTAQWPGASTIGERRLGGVLGVLLGRVFDIRKKPKPKPDQKERSTHMAVATPIPDTVQPLQVHSPSNTIPQHSMGSLLHISESLEGASSTENQVEGGSTGLPGSGSTSNIDSGSATNETNGLDFRPPPHLTAYVLDSVQSDVESLTALISAHGIATETSKTSLQHGTLRRSHTQSQKQSVFREPKTNERDKLEGKLRLQTLELERIALSVAVLQKAFDWSVLTNLTILDCAQHDKLWVMLRRHFQPSPLGVQHSSKHGSGLQYHLNLKKVHTDAASTALISFLKETLAPNTLETLFLQDRKRPSTTPVTIDAIYRGPLKRHRASLKRLMIDSSDRIPRGPGSASENARWRAWVPNRDILNFITSGRMSSLRELAIAIDYSNWHHFLQRLPQIPHLRSLNIPFIADHVTPAFDPRELAMQVVDVIVLRPEIQLCYMGVSHKCFEILENRPHDDLQGGAESHSSAANSGAQTDEEDEDDDEEGSDEDEDEDEEEDDHGTAIGAPLGPDPDETESEPSDHDQSDNDSWDGSDDGQSNVRLRLREILFYDDKVSIFKARHGRL